MQNIEYIKHAVHIVMTDLASSYTYMHMCNIYTSTDINTQVHTHTHLRAVWGHGTCAQRYGVNCGVCIFRIHWPMPRKWHFQRLSLSHNKSMCASTHMQPQLLNKSQRQFTDIFLKKRLWDKCRNRKKCYLCIRITRILHSE